MADWFGFITINLGGEFLSVSGCNINKRERNEGAYLLYAHAVPGDITKESWQPLEEHLSNVSKLAGLFAQSFDAEEWARLVGLVHDAGKASARFQKRLEGAPIQVDHSTAGAKVLSKEYGWLGKDLAFLVAGHHGGMPNGEKDGRRTSLNARLKEPLENYDDFFNLVELPDARSFMQSAPAFLRGLPAERLAFTGSFLLRMLYSCLVDADYLDTEAFVDKRRFEQRTYRGLTLQQMSDKLTAHMTSFNLAEWDLINQARQDIHQVCIDASKGKPGIYRLEVPTGGGKTLDSIDFALRHALANGMERIIYAIPYTSIVEQTAAVFKNIFGQDSVLEHHSNYDFKDADDETCLRERLNMENWDCPLIVTTNVQLFESIYAAKPSRCRKNHRLAKSVIVLDEAQSIPDAFLKPCLAAIEELADHYGSTVVMCTATQPVLDNVWPFKNRVTEIVPKDKAHFELFESRAAIQDIGKLEVGELAARLAAEDQVLCIVDTRKAAGLLFDILRDECGCEGLYHLSAFMVPAHRSTVLEEVKERLKNGLPCKVVSTQLIEAGVDIDFPTVFRELAGIDSIKQAAGRCNRNGKREQGNVYVFDCSEIAASNKSWLTQMRALGAETVGYFTSRGDDPFGEAGVKQFFTRRFSVVEKDTANVLCDFADFKHFRDALFAFDDCDKDFRFIDNVGTTVFVPWGQEGANLLELLREGKLGIREMRQAQRYTVSVPLWLLDRLENKAALTSAEGVPYLILEPFGDELRCYSEEKGLVADSNDEMAFLSV